MGYGSEWDFVTESIVDREGKFAEDNGLINRGGGGRMNECPFCGAAKVFTFSWTCGTSKYVPGFRRDAECYERQLAQQTTLLRRALGVIEDIVKARDNVLTMGILAFAKAQYKAQALASDLRAALEALEEKP